MTQTKKRPNWLLQGFIVLSLGVHVLVFLHIAGIYQSNAISIIELSMQEISKPNHRVIPMPRKRETPPAVSEIKTLQVKNVTIPKIKIDPIPKQTVDHSYDRILLPQVPENMNVASFAAAGLSIQDPAPPLEATVEYTTQKEYFDMLNLRIQRFKEYPESAKSRHIEGRVKIEFMVLKDGTLTDIRVIKSSRHKNLDDAAIGALKKASPFPKPPGFLFNPPVTMRINLLFELT